MGALADNRSLSRTASLMRRKDPRSSGSRIRYSRQSEWVKNILAAGGCELMTRGKKYQLSSPNVVHDATRQRFPIPVRIVLRIVGADEYMELSIR